VSLDLVRLLRHIGLLPPASVSPVCCDTSMSFRLQPTIAPSGDESAFPDRE
jgi:hypothetical protein